jgi:DNA-binding transcriptional LysR family regulator
LQQPFDSSQKNLSKTPLDNPRLLSGPFWGELRVFLAVAKAKSFNRAAEELNISQPTVSRQVRRLQDMIGSQLVVSSQNSIKLTPKGHELAEMLLSLDEKLFNISHELKAESLAAAGLVRVSITEALAGLFVVPSLPAFSDRYPKIQLHVRNPVSLTDFRNNQTDIMLGFAPAGGDVEANALGFMHMLPVASRNYIEHYGMPTHGNLENHVFIDSEYYSAKTGMWDAWQSILLRGEVAHICDNSFAYSFMVKAGLGIGLLGSYTLAYPVAIPLELGVHIRVPIYILAFSERLQVKPVRIVYNWLSELFSPRSVWFAPEINLHQLPKDTIEPILESISATPL